MRGNFVSVVLVLVGVVALVVNLDLVAIDFVQIVRTWWPVLLIAIGVALFFTPEPGSGKKR